MSLPVYRATRIVSALGGSSWPVLIETARGAFVTKLRGAAQGMLPLIAEVIVGEIASRLALPVPERAVIDIPPSVPTDDRRDELADVLGASRGHNLGLRFLEKATTIRQDQLHLVSPEMATRTVWMDAFVLNPDRTHANPNVLVSKRRPWLIDHGATLAFQYHWLGVDEDSPREPGPPMEHHLLIDRAAITSDADAAMAARLSREALQTAVEAVPANFLDAAYPGEDERRVRARYHAFLWKRLRPPRPFWPAGGSETG